MKIAVVGLGRIGLPTAVLCAMRGHDVVGVDRDRDLLNAIENRALPYEEPGLDDELHRISLNGELDEQADVWIVAVGTTTDGELDASALDRLVAEIAARGPRLVVVESTVPPGTCARLATEYGVPIAHCPERARPGQVFADIATMPRLIGGADDVAASRAMELYTTLTDAPLHRCEATESELAKLAENAEREVRIAFANELADIARDVGVDADRVIALANSHPRTAILRPGIGVGGHCLPMATRWFAARGAEQAAAARTLHEERPREVAARVTAGLKPGAKVCVIGRTYRPDTRYAARADGSDPYGSPAVELVSEMRELGFEVTSWDPSDEVPREEATAGADLVFVAVGHRAPR